MKQLAFFTLSKFIEPRTAQPTASLAAGHRAKPARKKTSSKQPVIPTAVGSRILPVKPLIPASPKARQRHGLGERARPRVHQHAPPRAELKKNAAAGRWNFRYVGREAHPTAPEGVRAPRDHLIPHRLAFHATGTVAPHLLPHLIRSFPLRLTLRTALRQSTERPPSRLGPRTRPGARLWFKNASTTLAAPQKFLRFAVKKSHRSRIALDLRMVVALWAKRGSSGFLAMRKTMGRGQDV